jgi:hypothetical protein
MVLSAFGLREAAGNYSRNRYCNDHSGEHLDNVCGDFYDCGGFAKH